MLKYLGIRDLGLRMPEYWFKYGVTEVSLEVPEEISQRKIEVKEVEIAEGIWRELRSFAHEVGRDAGAGRVAILYDHVDEDLSLSILRHVIDSLLDDGREVTLLISYFDGRSYTPQNFAVCIWFWALLANGIARMYKMDAWPLSRRRLLALSVLPGVAVILIGMGTAQIIRHLSDDPPSMIEYRHDEISLPPEEPQG